MLPTAIFVKEQTRVFKTKDTKKNVLKKNWQMSCKSPNSVHIWSSISRLNYSDPILGKGRGSPRLEQANRKSQSLAIHGIWPKPHLSDPKTLGSLDLQQFSLSFVETSGCFWHKGPRFCCSAQRAMFDHYCNPPHQNPCSARSTFTCCVCTSILTIKKGQWPTCGTNLQKCTKNQMENLTPNRHHCSKQKKKLRNMLKGLVSKKHFKKVQF